MIIYSVTISLDSTIEADWVKWMKEVHIPDVMATGCFVESHIQRLLDPPSEVPGAATFNVQYGCASMADYEKYRDQHAAELQVDHTERYKDRFVAFRTILQRI